MKTIAILGARGMLGSDLAATASREKWKVLLFHRPEFDILRETDLSLAAESADVIVNCAAYTAVDRAEIEMELCRKINTDAVGALGKAVREKGKYIVHVSTDFIFGDNGNAPLDENAAPNPLNYYGQTKLGGENLLRESGAHHSIIRLEWTYGRNGANFVSKIIALAEKKSPMKIVDDQVGSPTWTADAADAILRIAEKKAEGTFHFASVGYVSRFETAKFILDALNIRKEISPCRSSEFSAQARRPLNSRFDCSKIDCLLGASRPEWRNSLKKFLDL